MKTKTMSALLRAVLLAAGLLLVAFFFLFLPFYGQDTVRYAPEFAWAYWPCLIWAWAFAVPIFWAMVPAWRVCGSIAIQHRYHSHGITHGLFPIIFCHMS